ncbi:MAG: NADP-dependent oxidoreductase, partial [Pseudomonadota bacterium]
MSLRKIILASKPQGIPADTDFAVEPDTLAALQDGFVHLRILWLSLDPYMRGRISGRHLTGPILP